MKKRKELDALVSGGKSSTVKRQTCLPKKSCSAHELLRHDSDSSDMEDFSILQPRRKGRKKHGSRICITSVCLSLFQFVLVTSSCLVSGALIWFHIGLREDIDLLRAHIQKVEAGSRNTPEALHVIHSNLKQIDSNVTLLYIEVKKNIADINNLTLEVKALKSVAKNLKDSIAAAPAIEQLPKDITSLAEQIATFGSKMNALESNVKELKDQQYNLQTTTQSLSGELDTLKVSVQDLSNISDSQAKSSARDTNLQKMVRETNSNVEYLQGQLVNVEKSVDQVNTSLISQLSKTTELSGKIETVKDTVLILNNDTLLKNNLLTSIENFMRFNISSRIEQLETGHSVQKSWTSVNDLNKTISDAVLQIINNEIFHSDAHRENNTNSIEKTHDVLVLLAALLEKFEKLPADDILSNKAASELVKDMLQKSFDDLIIARDLKIKGIEEEVHNLTNICTQTNQNHERTQSDLTNSNSSLVLQHA